MYILVINAGASSLKFKIFKYSKKKNKTRSLLQGQIDEIKAKPAILEIENLEPNLIKKFELNLDARNLHLSAIKQLYTNNTFNQYSASIDYVVNLLPYTNNAQSDPIVRLHETTITELIKSNKGSMPIHQQQKINLDIAEYFIKLYPKCKHYGCFDDVFHQSIPSINKTLTPFENNHSHGIIFSSIAHKLNSLVDKKLSRGYWLIINLDKLTGICGIKKGKSLVTQNIVAKPKTINYIHEDINKLIQKNSSAFTDIDFYTLEIASKLTMCATLLGGLDGLVFTGKIGTEAPKIRQMILSKLEWACIMINRKANNRNKPIISHKTSLVKILQTLADEELEMVNLFINHKL
ncbi:MAG: acetate kinase [Burkholderiales bacterium]|jgi:acetate kinase|nr:acetate kinase [Burkholderiales bacterium]